MQSANCKVQNANLMNELNFYTVDLGIISPLFLTVPFSLSPSPGMQSANCKVQNANLMNEIRSTSMLMISG
jgi:hypothetical protein